MGLALSRKLGEKIILRISHDDLVELVRRGHGFKMTVLNAGQRRSNSTVFFFDAPQEMAIHREEIDKLNHPEESQ